MKGKVSVPVRLQQTHDGTGRFLLTWSEAALTGDVYDVQPRFEPLGGTFAPWASWDPPSGGPDWGTLASVGFELLTRLAYDQPLFST